MRRRSHRSEQTVVRTPAPALSLKHEPSAQDYYVRHEPILLPYGARGEQQEIETWKALVNDPDFREDIQRVQHGLGPTYWKTLSQFQTISEDLERQFGAACTPLLTKFDEDH